MPSHISVNNLGLTYKGTVGLSMATIPDVCKTPSPGGPVPLPYPNIAEQSSLSDGTTTVFAKGKMIAIKGSHYSRSNGDEPGTVGGVKSNVNMKATDWITYSFDVKMDGQNACRHTDKKFHNDKNTVDLGGNVDPRSKTEGTVLVILCEDAPKGKTKSGKPRKKYDECELEEICAKIKAYDAALKGRKSFHRGQAGRQEIRAGWRRNEKLRQQRLQVDQALRQAGQGSGRGRKARGHGVP